MNGEGSGLCRFLEPAKAPLEVAAVRASEGTRTQVSSPSFLECTGLDRELDGVNRGALLPAPGRVDLVALTWEWGGLWEPRCTPRVKRLWNFVCINSLLPHTIPGGRNCYYFTEEETEAQKRKLRHRR